MLSLHELSTLLSVHTRVDQSTAEHFYSVSAAAVFYRKLPRKHDCKMPSDERHNKDEGEKDHYVYGTKAAQ